MAKTNSTRQAEFRARMREEGKRLLFACVRGRDHQTVGFLTLQKRRFRPVFWLKVAIYSSINQCSVNVWLVQCLQGPSKRGTLLGCT